MMTAPPPDWFAKAALAVFNALSGALSGWVLFAIALAGAAILSAPIRVGEVDLVQIRHDWGGWILAATILCGLLVLAKLAQRATISIKHARQRRTERRAREKAEAQVLAHLDTLLPVEKEVLRRCISEGARTIIVSFMAPAATVGVRALASKGLIEGATEVNMNANALPYTIPAFVWNELQRRRDSFLAVAKE